MAQHHQLEGTGIVRVGGVIKAAATGWWQTMSVLSHLDNGAMTAPGSYHREEKRGSKGGERGEREKNPRWEMSESDRRCVRSRQRE